MRAKKRGTGRSRVDGSRLKCTTDVRGKEGKLLIQEVRFAALWSDWRILETVVGETNTNKK